MSDERNKKMRRCLDSAFAPSSLEIIDESHLHAGHPGARDGRGHFRVNLVSDSFSGKRALERHRMVFAALGELMQTDIHAVSINARAPEEVSRPGTTITTETKE